MSRFRRRAARVAVAFVSGVLVAVQASGAGASATAAIGEQKLAPLSPVLGNAFGDAVAAAPGVAVVGADCGFAR